MTHPTRNIILVVGSSASGKTFGLEYTRVALKTLGIRYENIPISDAQTILERIREDDERGGRNHYHDWNRGQLGHSHSHHSGITPFTLAGREIGIAFMRDFFGALANVPSDGKIWRAEWSGGVNKNSKNDPASLTDVSFATISGLLHDGTIRSDGLDHVLAILHMQASREHRMHLNNSRSGAPDPELVRLGRASWKLDATAMRIFGEDDFDAAIPVLREHGIPIIRTIHNEGRDELYQKLDAVLPEILSFWRGGETGQGGLKRKEH